jgi:hypothetical protein
VRSEVPLHPANCIATGRDLRIEDVDDVLRERGETARWQLQSVRTGDRVNFGCAERASPYAKFIERTAPKAATARARADFQSVTGERTVELVAHDVDGSLFAVDVQPEALRS